MEISGGGLGHVYSTLQFHFHWGSSDSHGSEHMVDSHRYPMEVTDRSTAAVASWWQHSARDHLNCTFEQMHIVSRRKDLTLDQAVQTPNGLAVLGFFIEVTRIVQTNVPGDQFQLHNYQPEQGSRRHYNETVGRKTLNWGIKVLICITKLKISVCFKKNTEMTNI